MTDSTDRVLASIDETLDGYVSEDWAVSGDAMRWQPEQPEQPQKPAKAYWAPAGTMAGGLRTWTELGHVAHGGFVYGTPSQAEAAEAARRLQEQITAQVRVNVEAVQTAFGAIAESVKQVGKAFAKLVDANHPGIARLQHGDDYRRHRRSCRLCNLAGNPKPLGVNGAEYSRRTRARRRKNRR